MQHNHLTFPITDAFIAMVSSCRAAKDHRQTWGSDQQGPTLWLVKDHGIYLVGPAEFTQSLRQTQNSAGLNRIVNDGCQFSIGIENRR